MTENGTILAQYALQYNDGRPYEGLSDPTYHSDLYVVRSADGGQTWENVLFVNEKAGAADLVMDPSNPRILFASLWRVKRTPYSLESGGEGSGFWKSKRHGLF